MIFFTPKSYLISGAGIVVNNGLNTSFNLDELYLHFQNTRIYATAGRKQQRELFNGLSASNLNILWSLNSRPLWGIQVGTAEPFFFTGEEGLGFEASWSEYWMGKDRFVEDALLHHKSFQLIYRKNSWEMKAGLQHFVQWSGTSIEYGKQPDTLEDYWRIITGRKGAKGAYWGDQANALGNHLGGYEMSVTKKFRNFNLCIFFNHLFEDGSGMMLRNTPDGRYGIFLEKEKNSALVNSIVYEFYYTKNQSFYFPNTDGRDNYFNNLIYKTGWTYNNMVIGAPFFTVDPAGEGVINNKFIAHHLGIGGEIEYLANSYPYKLLLSYARNDGLYSKSYSPKQDVFYFFTDVQLIKTDTELHLQVGADVNSYTSPVYGMGLEMKYKFK